MAKTEPLYFRHVRPSVCPSVRLSVCLSVCLSVRPYVTAIFLGIYEPYMVEIYKIDVIYEPQQNSVGRLKKNKY